MHILVIKLLIVFDYSTNLLELSGSTVYIKAQVLDCFDHILVHPLNLCCFGLKLTKYLSYK